MENLLVLTLKPIPRSYDDVLRLANYVKSLVPISDFPKIGIICGSGLADIGDAITEKFLIPYSSIPEFPQTSVTGHKGNLLFGKLGGKTVVCLQGRFHPYEHSMNLALCSLPVRMMHLMGVTTLIVSNAAGGINDTFKKGDFMLIKDHVCMPALAGHSPLVGLNDPRWGLRFVSLKDQYDVELRKTAKIVAEKQGIKVHEGVYVMSGGPQYESGAEIELYKRAGCDALGMSTSHEVIVARQCGIKVLGISVISNIANEEANPSHLEVLETAQAIGYKITSFVEGIIREL
uniref:Purine nucleoside phosphorylase n=1 Tax=Syphacia muris TaxID=451379 RepID=A0A0N5B0R6_9BILA